MYWKRLRNLDFELVPPHFKSDHNMTTKNLVKEDNMYNTYIFCDELYYETLHIIEAT